MKINPALQSKTNQIRPPQMNKAILKFINEMEPLFPVVVEHRQTEEVVWSGADLILAGFGENRSIEPDKKYVIDSPVWFHVDHKKRMKRLYQKQGRQAVMDYVYQNIN